MKMKSVFANIKSIYLLLRNPLRIIIISSILCIFYTGSILESFLSTNAFEYYLTSKNFTTKFTITSKTFSFPITTNSFTLSLLLYVRHVLNLKRIVNRSSNNANDRNVRIDLHVPRNIVGSRSCN